MDDIAICSPVPDKHYQGIVDLINQFERVPVTLAQVARERDLVEEGKISRHMVAAAPGGQVAGLSMAIHRPWYPQGRFYLWVSVDTAHRGMGLGSRLYDEVLAFVNEQGVESLISEVRDDDPASLRFATERGFTINRHQYESELDLVQFDETPFRDLIPALEASGIRFFSLADAGDTREALRKLHQVNYATALDVPGSIGDWNTFEEFEHLVRGADWFNPEGQLLAADGEEYIGLAAVRLIPEERMAYNLMTGVQRAYRGRKIAQALKLIAIRYAIAHGAERIRTDNDSLNAPMLAVNRKFGYRPCPGKLMLRKEKLV